MARSNKEMKTRFLNIWDKLHTSYWFIPSLMTVAAMVLSMSVVQIDRRVSGDFWASPWRAGLSPEGARTILATIAGSMITVAGVVFSITIVALTAASSQFGPRLLRSFMRDRGNQIVLGTFVATFVYCLLLLRSIHGENGGASFVPNLGLAIALLFMLLSLGVFIFFIHHAADSMQAPTVAAVVAEELDEILHKQFPENRKGEKAGASAEALPEGFHSDAAPIRAIKRGYLQVIDVESLTRLAQKRDFMVSVRAQVGEFIVTGNELGRVWPAGSADESGLHQLACCFLVGRHRTTEQDVEFPVQQLVDIALRALSPSLNDPFTAITCVNHLGAALCVLAGRPSPTPCHFDADGRLRIVTEPTSLARIMDTAIRPLRQHGTGDLSFAEALMTNLLHIARRVRRAIDAEAVRRHADEVLAEAERRMTQPRDRERLRALYRGISRVLAGAAGSSREPGEQIYAKEHAS